jgi:hypothetical protein
MSRATRLNRTIRRTIERQLKDKEQKTPAHRKQILRNALSVLGILGTLVTLLALLPRMSVSVSDPPDPDWPFSSSVTVVNAGFVPLRSVRPCMGVRQFGTKGAHATPNFKPPYEGAIFCSVRLDAQDLGLDQRFTFALNDILSIPASNLEFADIAVILEYKPWLLPWKQKKIFPMTTRRQSNGHFYWYQKAAD